MQQTSRRTIGYYLELLGPAITVLAWLIAALFLHDWFVARVVGNDISWMDCLLLFSDGRLSKPGSCLVYLALSPRRAAA